MVVLTFDRTLASLPAQTFVDDILVRRLDVAAVVAGYDFISVPNAPARRISFETPGPVGLRCRDRRAHRAGRIRLARGGLSTATREALERGDVAMAARLFGHLWFVDGEVLHGRKVGRTLGFPTANIALDPSCDCATASMPCAAPSTAHAVDGVASFGTRPVFDNGPPLLEVYLFDFDGDLYGRVMEVAFVGFIRGEATSPRSTRGRAHARRPAQARKILLPSPPIPRSGPVRRHGRRNDLLFADLASSRIDTRMKLE